MKNVLTSSIVVLIWLCAVASLQAQGDANATLAWKLEKGDQLEVQYSQKQNLLTRIDARDRALDSEIILGCDWTVTDVAESGNATIEQTIRRIRILTGTPGAAVKKLVDIDTATDAKLRGISRDMMRLVKSLLGLKFTLEMTPSGKLLSFTAGAEVAGALAEFPETSALPRMFSAKAMARLISDSAFVLSADKVGKGDSWNEESKVSMTARDGRVFAFDRTVKSTVSEIDEKQANIDVEIALTQDDTPTAKVESALTSPLELTAFTGSGKIVFDRSEGIISSSEVTSQTKTRVIYREDQVKTTVDMISEILVSRKSNSDR